MKTLLFLVIAVAGMSSLVAAQAKAQLTAKINTPTVQCDMCKERIETYLKRYDGVTSVNVNVKKKETTVKYLTDRTNIENIKAAIANAGYDADDVPANPDAYKDLPKCCKKPEDGGGMSKPKQ
ncbi:MAG TPA: heavy-metal-associated domain-containing protein [Chitinophagaceae bacterium]|jgi:copper chaperone CopZ|nr:heavy-metal-associated domain-containing protein [Chitinophagaceae bacterium]